MEKNSKRGLALTKGSPSPRMIEANSSDYCFKHLGSRGFLAVGLLPGPVALHVRSSETPNPVVLEIISTYKDYE